MKYTKRHIVIMAMLLLGAMALLVPDAVEAAGTTAGTAIRNRASVNYDVSGVPQTVIESSPTGNTTPGAGAGADTTFTVIIKASINVARIDATAVTSYPSSTTTYVSFVVSNPTNTMLDIRLESLDEASTTVNPFGGTADGFNAASTTVVIESDATPGPSAGDITGTYIDNLVSDGTRTVYIVATMPGGLTPGQVAVQALRATVVNVTGSAGTPGSDLTNGGSMNGIEVVFADPFGTDDAASPTRDGKHSERSAWAISAASLTVTKSSAVYWDPINLFSTPKLIPGAIVTYTVTVANAAGGSAASNVTITDNLNNEIAVNGRLLFRTPYADTAQPLACGAGEGSAISINGAAFTCSAGTWNAGTNTLTVSGLNVPVNQNVRIRYQVTIQ